ncbi:Programmed cell death protein 2 [Frankliniella fusca]|uniref:Programmed cell death protein 2 n=1 Tax=Frankliniella fusca TaxID=407009 RepID=A0AAE1HE56_9NEOP|nr:Programmed cell death protein 2 [Frankliniella fusca]
MDPSDSNGGDQALKLLKLCAYCKKKSSLFCARCGVVYYCSKEHQTSDWKTHQKKCTTKLYKIFQGAPNKPYVLVASTDIPVNTIISKSQAIAVGPSGGEPVCLGCLRPLIYDVLSFTCTDCGWPVCGEDCQKTEMHQLECKAFQSVGFQFNSGHSSLFSFSLFYFAEAILKIKTSSSDELRTVDWRAIFPTKPGPWILILRILLSGKAKKLLKYYHIRESDVSFRYILKITPHFMYGVHFIREELKLKQFEPEDIARIFHLYTESAFQMPRLKDHLPISEPRQAAAMVASDLIYVQRSCQPNLEFKSCVDNPLQIKSVSCKNIQRGEKLSMYKGMSILCVTSTYSRQYDQQMRQLRGPCDCQRCSDATELGLYMSSLRCKKCEDMMVPISTANILVTDWTCKACKLILKCSEYKEKIMMLQKELQSFASRSPKDTLTDLENFIRTHSERGGVLHKTHELIIQAKRLYCSLAYQFSVETGAAFKFDSGVLNLLKKYVNDYVTFHSSFNTKFVAETILLKVVYLKNTIYKLNNREITKDHAQQFLVDNCGYFPCAVQEVFPDICNHCSGHSMRLFFEFLGLFIRLHNELL